MPESGQAVVGIPDLEKENAELKMKVDAMRTMSNQLWHQYIGFLFDFMNMLVRTSVTIITSKWSIVQVRFVRRDSRMVKVRKQGIPGKWTLRKRRKWKTKTDYGNRNTENAAHAHKCPSVQLARFPDETDHSCGSLI